MARAAVRGRRRQPKPIQDHLPKVDPAAQEVRLRYWEDVTAQARRDRVRRCPPAEQINYDVYHPQIEVLIASQRFRDFEMPANSDTTFWTDIGYTARRTFRKSGGVQQLARPAARHPALFPRADGRDARRPEARLHAAASDHGGARRFDHGGDERDSRGEPLLHTVQGYAGDSAGRAGSAARRGGEDDPRRRAARLR